MKRVNGDESVVCFSESLDLQRSFGQIEVCKMETKQRKIRGSWLLMLMGV